jgi:hypothetical protein
MCAVSVPSTVLTLLPTPFFDMLPSDPDYIPAAQDKRIVDSPFYQRLLRLNMDPYAAHSRDESMIAMVEEYFATGRTKP